MSLTPTKSFNIDPTTSLHMTLSIKEAGFNPKDLPDLHGTIPGHVPASVRLLCSQKATYKSYVARVRVSPINHDLGNEGLDLDKRQNIPPGTHSSATNALDRAKTYKERVRILDEYIEARVTQRQELLSAGNGEDHDSESRRVVPREEEMDTYRDPRSALEHRINGLDMMIESFQRQRERVVSEELQRWRLLGRVWGLVMGGLFALI